MPILGRVAEFCVESGNISTNLDRVEQFFIANDIAHGIQSKVKLATIVEGDPKAPFSIAYYTKV